ncbi:MAG: hypothetical protein IJ215_03935 [Clostridia bacterium]|nr:hypothetical protein [Clostridia bacterium]
MLWYPKENQLVTLVCFYTKKGEESQSPYQAQRWKDQSIPVYARLKNKDESTFDALVRQIYFQYRHTASITVKVQNISKKYELTNVICNVRALTYHKLYFFYDNISTRHTIKSAWNQVFAESNEADCQEKIKMAMANGQPISILYVENSSGSSTTTGIIPDVQEYDTNLKIIITQKQKIFLIEKH